MSRIDLTDSTTVMHIEARFTPHWWIKIVSSRFLADENGNKYPVMSATGESFPKETWENMIADLKGEHYRLNKRQSTVSLGQKR